MELEWDDYGWHSVDGKMRLCSSKENNDHRIVSYFGTKIKTSVLSWTKSKTEYSHDYLFNVTVMETCNGETYLVCLRKEVDDGT